MDVLLIDSWDQNKQDKRIIFLRQSLSLSVEVVPPDRFSQTRCLEMLVCISLLYSRF